MHLNLVFFISGIVKASITAAVGELFFLKTQEMVDNLLKIEYFHLKTLLCIKGGDTSRTFKKSKNFFLLKSIGKLFKNIIPKFYWSTPNISVEKGPSTTSLRLVFSKLTFFIRPSGLRANYSTDLLE